MNFSTLFRLEENLHLDKKTLVTLRWIAIIGQLVAINFVYYYLKLELPIVAVHTIVLVGFITNLIYIYLTLYGQVLKAVKKNI